MDIFPPKSVFPTYRRTKSSGDELNKWACNIGRKPLMISINLKGKSALLLEIFPPKSVFPAYRRTKNLKDILAPSKFCGARG